ncbi:MAG TPA: hypothetical protein VFZ69_09585 [Longimicrobiales bacterium]
MEELIRIAALVAATTGSPGAPASVPVPGVEQVERRARTSDVPCATAACVPAPQLAAHAPQSRTAPAAWPGEDKFRHVAMSWATMAFTYAAARAAEQDSDTALAIALPVTAAAGIGKEIADRRGGGPFSFGDLVADAIGTGIGWLFLREVR